jgi:hypothetical protein
MGPWTRTGRYPSQRVALSLDEFLWLDFDLYLTDFPYLVLGFTHQPKPRCHPVGGQQDPPGGGHNGLPVDGHVLTLRNRLGGATAPCDAPSTGT